MANVATVTPEQWDEARRLFESRMDEINCSVMPQEKYDKIVGLLANWDSLEPSARWEVSAGNAFYWRMKYTIADLGGRVLVLAGSHKRVCTREILFDSIKEVHTNSECHLTVARMTSCVC